MNQRPTPRHGAAQVRSASKTPRLLIGGLLLLFVVIAGVCLGLFVGQSLPSSPATQSSNTLAFDGGDLAMAVKAESDAASATVATALEAQAAAQEAERNRLAQEATVDAAKAKLSLTTDFRDSFNHGPKGAEYQKYIVLHDTEGEGSASSVADWWDSNGAGVAAHFIINKNGTILQCAPLDSIVHHAGFGDTGHNASFGVEDESRDDKVGTTSIGSWAADYGMNSYSIGIEMVHVGGSGDYPKAQLEALDNLIAYIDAYYGFESEIIDHKAWRSGNSDTSPEFATYLQNYQTKRTHQ